MGMLLYEMSRMKPFFLNEKPLLLCGTFIGSDLTFRGVACCVLRPRNRGVYIGWIGLEF